MNGFLVIMKDENNEQINHFNFDMEKHDYLDVYDFCETMKAWYFPNAIFEMYLMENLDTPVEVFD